MPLIETEIGGLSIDVVTDGNEVHLLFVDDSNDLDIELELTAAQIAGTDWFILKVVRDGTSLKVVIDTEEVADETVASVSYFGDATLMDGKKAYIFDPRFLAKAISKAASDYYVDNVENDDGDGVMPRW